MDLKTLVLITLYILLLAFPSFAQEDSLTDGFVLIDGSIGDDEYSFHLELEDGVFDIYWEVIDDQIYFGLVGKTDGYVGINVDPGFILTDADLYYGFVNGSGDFMVDTFSDSVTGPPKLDIDHGGTDDILAYNGTEINDVTTFEFTRLLVTDDKDHDNDIKLENTRIAWTIGSRDDISDRPADSGRHDIDFTKGTGEEVFDYIPYIIGGIIVVIVVLLFFIIRKLRKRKLS